MFVWLHTKNVIIETLETLVTKNMDEKRRVETRELMH